MMILIQNKIQETFLLDTQEVVTQDAIVVFVPENNYTLPFVISGGSYIFNDKMNTSLTNDFQTSENVLKNMKVDRKISTLIYFDNNRKLLMNEFISWHMWIKEFFNTNCVMNYNMLTASQRKLKTDIFDKLYDQFSLLRIKIFYPKIK